MDKNLYVVGEQTIETYNKGSFAAQMVKIGEGVYRLVQTDPEKLKIIRFEIGG